MPLPEFIDQFANTHEDYHQDRQVLAVEYYGNAWERLSSEKRAKVDLWHCAGRNQYQSAEKRKGKTVHFRTEDDYPLGTLRPVLSYDVRRCLEMLWKGFPDEIVDAAFEMITFKEAARKLRRREADVRNDVYRCRDMARQLLGDDEWDRKDWLKHKHRVRRELPDAPFHKL